MTVVTGLYKMENESEQEYCERYKNAYEREISFRDSYTKYGHDIKCDYCEDWFDENKIIYVKDSDKDHHKVCLECKRFYKLNKLNQKEYLNFQIKPCKLCEGIA